MGKTYARRISSLDITEQGMLVYDNVGDEYVEVDEDGNPYPVSYLAKTMSREEADLFSRLRMDWIEPEKRNYP